LIYSRPGEIAKLADPRNGVASGCGHHDCRGFDVPLPLAVATSALAKDGETRSCETKFGGQVVSIQSAKLKDHVLMAKTSEVAGQDGQS
jgi:hypothetical protein